MEEITIFVCPQCESENFEVGEIVYDEFENIDSQVVTCNECGKETFVEWHG